MPTSASCRPEAVGPPMRGSNKFHGHASSGFTLLEILVVMALVALVSVAVGPNLQRLVSGVEAASQRDTLLLDLAGLGTRAARLGQSFELSASTSAQLLSDGEPILRLPTGWRIAPGKPIFYGFNGYCAGGELGLQTPDGRREQLAMTAPRCAVRPGNAR